MADLMLKVGDKGPRAVDWKDGDVIHALNDRRIQCCHAEMICFEKNGRRKFAAMTPDLLLPNTHVSRDMLETCCQYRFERVSRAEIDRVTIATGDRVRIDNTPRMIDGKKQHMHVEQYVARRMAGLRSANSTGKPMYGTVGSEVWYGGRSDMSSVNVSAVWDAIETKTPHRRADTVRQRWPAGRLDLRQHLMVRVDSFDDATAALLETPIVDETDPENPIITARRRHDVDWRNALSLTVQDVADADDRTTEFDLRERTAYLRNSVVRDKEAV